MTHRRNGVIIALTICIAIVVGIGGTVAQSQSDPDSFSMALTGNALISGPLSVYKEPAFIKMVELIRGADVAMTAVESVFHDYESYEMPANYARQSYMRAPPSVAKDLSWAGFDLAALATNHSQNFGIVGQRLTSKYVAEAGLVGAGTGESLAEAREAKFLETPRGRVALISVASTFPEYSRASATRGDIPARPGLNPLRYSTTYVVTPQRMAEMRTTLTEMRLAVPAGPSDRLNFFGQEFITGNQPDVRTEPHAGDMEAIAAVVRNAARLADYTIVTIHAHEADRNPGMPAQFLVTFAHAMIEAGADVFSGHGPTNLRGVEIYKGKPILYSLGDFIWGIDTVQRQPSESYEVYGLAGTAGVADWNEKRGVNMNREVYESVIAVPRWRGKQFVELALHPITLGFGKKGNQYGRPMLAEPALSRKILDDLLQRSKPFGTRITTRDDIGYVELANLTSAQR